MIILLLIKRIKLLNDELLIDELNPRSRNRTSDQSMSAAKQSRFTSTVDRSTN